MMWSSCCVHGLKMVMYGHVWQEMFAYQLQARNRAAAGMEFQSGRGLAYHRAKQARNALADSRKEYADMGTDRLVVPESQRAARVCQSDHTARQTGVDGIPVVGPG